MLGDHVCSETSRDAKPIGTAFLVVTPWVVAVIVLRIEKAHLVLPGTFQACVLTPERKRERMRRERKVIGSRGPGSTNRGILRITIAEEQRPIQLGVDRKGGGNRHDVKHSSLQPAGNGTHAVDV